MKGLILLLALLLPALFWARPAAAVAPPAPEKKMSGAARLAEAARAFGEAAAALEEGGWDENPLEEAEKLRRRVEGSGATDVAGVRERLAALADYAAGPDPEERRRLAVELKSLAGELERLEEELAAPTRLRVEDVGRARERLEAILAGEEFREVGEEPGLAKRVEELLGRILGWFADLVFGGETLKGAGAILRFLYAFLLTALFALLALFLLKLLRRSRRPPARRPVLSSELLTRAETPEELAARAEAALAAGRSAEAVALFYRMALLGLASEEARLNSRFLTDREILALLSREGDAAGLVGRLAALGRLFSEVRYGGRAVGVEEARSFGRRALELALAGDGA